MAEKDKILSRGVKIEISLNWSYLWLIKSVCCDYMKYMELIDVCFMWSLDNLRIRYLTFIPNKYLTNNMSLDIMTMAEYGILDHQRDAILDHYGPI